jgi:formylmethanofuran dehydrogenase subunit C
MSLFLTWKSATSLPVDGSPLKPETFRGMSADQARRMMLRVGNTTERLGELFEVKESEGDDVLTALGDLSHVRGLGRGMSSGRLVVRGAAGSRLGAEMTGGRIEVEGPAGDWAGAEMRGGLIVIRGITGSFLGAAFAGSRLGMREGVILVHGSTGDDAGLQMRRGVIAIRGSAGVGLGRGMIAGTIVALGNVGSRAAAGMKRGTLVLPALDRDSLDHLLPTFALAGSFSLPFLSLYAQQLGE